MDFDVLFEEPQEKEELTQIEYEELINSLPEKAEKARLALEDWLTAFKRLGFWSSCDEDLRCIVQAYNALENPESE